MDLGIGGKVALVTGGSRGIGREISRELGCDPFPMLRPRFVHHRRDRDGRRRNLQYHHMT